MLGVGRARHGVEGTHVKRVLVHHEEVGAVLLRYEVAQLLLVLRREVTKGVGCPVNPSQKKTNRTAGGGRGRSEW